MVTNVLHNCYMVKKIMSRGMKKKKTNWTSTKCISPPSLNDFGIHDTVLQRSHVVKARVRLALSVRPCMHIIAGFSSVT